MKMQKTWATVTFAEGDAYIEISMNYETKTYYLSHGSNDRNVTFDTDDGESIKTHFDRAKCVVAALNYIQSELKLTPEKKAK